MNTMKTQVSGYPNINDTITELAKTLENLKTKKAALDKDLENGEKLKAQLEEKLLTCSEELQRIVESLEQKQSVLSVYDKILNESESAYSKIVKSTQALYQMVKNEEKKVTGKTSFNYSVGK